MPSRSRKTFSVGLIADTHGLLRPQALAALAGSRHIVHAGDIGAPEILQALERIAPVTAVRGNNDAGPWARRLPEQAVLEARPLAPAAQGSARRRALCESRQRRASPLHAAGVRGTPDGERRGGALPADRDRALTPN